MVTYCYTCKTHVTHEKPKDFTSMGHSSDRVRHTQRTMPKKQRALEWMNDARV